MDQGSGMQASDTIDGGASTSLKSPVETKSSVQIHNVVWEEVMSRRNGKGYKIGDYIYQKDRTSRKGIWYLRCKRRKKLACKGRAIVSGENGKNEVKIMGEHNHDPEPDSAESCNFTLKFH